MTTLHRIQYVHEDSKIYQDGDWYQQDGLVWQWAFDMVNNLHRWFLVLRVIPQGRKVDPPHEDV